MLASEIMTVARYFHSKAFKTFMFYFYRIEIDILKTDRIDEFVKLIQKEPLYIEHI